MPQPTTYQGPSWSWLSVNGPVSFDRVCRPSEYVAEILSCETEPANKTAPYGLIREGSGRQMLAARTAAAVRIRVPSKPPGRFADWVKILGVSKSVVCYTFAKMRCDVQEAEIDEEKKAAGCLVVEISRRNEKDKLSCEGLVLQPSSPETKTYSRIGRFSYYRGHLFPELVKDGQSAEVDFNWFANEPTFIEII